MESLLVGLLELALIIFIASFVLRCILWILGIPVKIIRAISGYKYNSTDSVLYMMIDSLNFNCEETSHNELQVTSHDTHSFDSVDIN
ncbi:hypothetical protein ACL6C3_13505 [Capilliphycus salinus ALCB114379]|uniref:hypothetical protein n=1 Tax=Capilliphycus salinus TaxID=2768948 RepID=UPI0039A649C8